MCPRGMPTRILWVPVGPYGTPFGYPYLDHPLPFQRIYVTDVNDNDPKFLSRDHAYVFVDEPIGYPLIYVAAVDDDWLENGRVTYRITSGNDDGQFQLNSTSGMPRDPTRPYLTLPLPCSLFQAPSRYPSHSKGRSAPVSTI